MNMNALRTWATIAGFISAGLAVGLGCTTEIITGATDCSASWLGPKVGGMAAMGFLALNVILKAIDNPGGLFGKQ